MLPKSRVFRVVSHRSAENCVKYTSNGLRRSNPIYMDHKRFTYVTHVSLDRREPWRQKHFYHVQDIGISFIVFWMNILNILMSCQCNEKSRIVFHILSITITSNAIIHFPKCNLLIYVSHQFLMNTCMAAWLRWEWSYTDSFWWEWDERNSRNKQALVSVLKEIQFHIYIRA